jgi:hypothetical protein
MNKKKINFNTSFRGLDDKTVVENGQELNLGQILASRIAYSNRGAGKLMFLGFDIYKGNELELDASDVSLLRNFVEEDEAMTNLLKYRILELL